MARILGFGLGNTQSIFAAELIGILLCLHHFVAALVKHFAVLVVDAVHDQVVMRRVLSRAFSTKAVKFLCDTNWKCQTNNLMLSKAVISRCFIFLLIISPYNT